MHIERREIPAHCILVLFGDKSYKDLATIERTLRMVLPYQKVTVHYLQKSGAVEHGVKYLRESRHQTMSFCFHDHYDSVVVAAINGDGPDCRVCCIVYWNGEELDTLKGLQRAVMAGIETGVIPHERGKTWE